MAIDSKYGKISIPGIPDNEPVFVLRAKDSLAARGVEAYAVIVRKVARTGKYKERTAAGLAFADKIERAAEALKGWSDSKLPD